MDTQLDDNKEALSKSYERFDKKARRSEILGYSMIAGSVILYGWGCYASYGWFKKVVKQSVKDALLEMAEEDKIHLKMGFFGR